MAPPCLPQDPIRSPPTSRTRRHRTSKAHLLSDSPICDEHIFTWLELAAEGVSMAKTTNALYGGPNKAIENGNGIQKG